MNYRSMPPRTRLLVGCTLALFAATAMADDEVSSLDGQYALSRPDDPEVTRPEAWHFVVGAGAINRPTFPGASSTKTEALPVLGASYGRFFIGESLDAVSLLALGAYLYTDSHWRLGVAITYDVIQPREESDDPHLTGLGNIDRSAHAEAFGVFTYGWIVVRGSVVGDIGENQRGTWATFDVLARYLPTPQWALAAGPGLRWGTSEYNRTFFGVDSDQSARSGLPVYSLGTGVNLLRFSAAASYRPTVNWSFGASVTTAWLQGDASNSPIVQKSSQVTYAVTANYRF